MNDRCRLRGIVADDLRLGRFYRILDPTGLVEGGHITPHWMLDGASFWYAQGPPENTILLRVDGDSGSVAPLLVVAKVRAALSEILGRDLPNRGLPFASIVELGAGRYQFAFEGQAFVLSTDDYRIEPISRESVGPQVWASSSTDRMTPRIYRRTMWCLEPMLVAEAPSPDRRWFASVQDGNISLRAAVDDRTMPLTSDGTRDFAWDIEAPRVKLTAGMEIRQHVLEPWSPDGNRLFAIKSDRRAVPEYPLVRYLKREEEVTSVKVQRAGGNIDISHPHVLDVLSKRAQRLDVGDTQDQFFTLIGWLADASEVIFTRHSRDFKTVDVLVGNPVNGSVRTILSETVKTFVALQHDVVFGGDNHATILSDGSGLIWRSSRSGWNHFYLYAIDCTSTRALTQGSFPVIDVVEIDDMGKWLYFTAHHDPDRPYDTHLCRVSFEGGEIQRLTLHDGQNVVSVSPSKRTFTVVNSRPDRPFRTDFHLCDGKHLAMVQDADVTGLEALGHVASEEFRVTAADGETTLWGVMHKPADFDPKKTYPLIDHLYGGPQVTFVSHTFGIGADSNSRIDQALLDRALAQLGYIVISVDARGTPERSKAFQDVVYRNWGRHEIPDHVATVHQLAQRHKFIDVNRVGVWGYSWGGYFTIRALAQAPETFHVGVAAAPGINPYDLFIYEPYLDLPTRAKAEYDYANNQLWASKIVGKLMLITGTSDAPIHSESMDMAYYLIQAGVDHEFVVLPEANHYYQGKDQDYFIHKLVSHFENHLKRR